MHRHLARTGRELHTALVDSFVSWLIQGGVGPALFGPPVSWAAKDLAEAASRWFRRLRRSNGLSRIVRAAAGAEIDLSDAEFAEVRRLLERESTWADVGRKPIEDLAALIASCLEGRDDEGSRAAGRAIASGLLEFAVRDLEPEWFQRVLFARLDRLQTSQASALDAAMLSVHADLAAWLAQQDDADAARSVQIMGQLARVLERLPPGQAGEGEVALYLAALIKWLNTDPWPRDRRFAGPVLTPAAIERKLKITEARRQDEQDLPKVPDVGRLDEQDVDADGLARTCERLVVLGGPGAGKTWLAKRTARRCAEDALVALTAGAAVDEVELPLYTTCSELLGAAGDIRQAVVSSALSQLPDLGSARVSAALQEFFAERNAPTVLVIDSLDEALGPDERLRQADSLKPPWRIILTSRPVSWNHQLDIGDDDPSRRVGVLQPLLYPKDVEPFITRWFSQRPEWGDNLRSQLARRPELQQAATVPLIMAFYCIVGGSAPLPSRRSDLYRKVIKQMLTGRWRDSSDRDPDADVCLETLRDWAWSGAAKDPVSAVGIWADEIATPRTKQSQADRDALDHIATPLGPRDVYSGEMLRRFIHRSIREHLVAEHVALRMTPEDAARELLNHIWYDPDWEYAAPVALAMHPQRDQVLRNLVGHLTNHNGLNEDLSAIDDHRDIRRFLTRVALASGEDDWSAEAAAMIGQARIDMMQDSDLLSQATADWPSTNDTIRKALLAELTVYRGGPLVRKLAEALVRLAVTAHDRARAREELLALLSEAHTSDRASPLASALTGLDPSERDRARAREALLRLLARQTDVERALELAEALAMLAVTPQDRARARQKLLALLSTATYSERASRLAETLAGLDPPEQERARAREALSDLLAKVRDTERVQELAEAMAELAVTAEDRAQSREKLLGLLANTTVSRQAARLAKALVNLHPSEQERARVREALLDLLSRETTSLWALLLVETLAELQPVEQDRAQAREALLRLLATEPITGRAGELACALTRLHPSEQDRSRAREGLANLLARERNDERVQELAQALAGLAVTAEDQARARETLLELLTNATHERGPVRLAEMLATLDPTEQDRARAREALLGLLASAPTPRRAQELTQVLAELAVTVGELAQAREALLGPQATAPAPARAEHSAEVLTGLAVTAEERAHAREALLGLLAQDTSSWEACRRAGELARLQPTEHDRERALQALLRLLDQVSHSSDIRSLADALVGLALTAEERAQVRTALFRLLAQKTADWAVDNATNALARLAVTAEERAQVREALIAVLAREREQFWASRLMEIITRLDPKASDLEGSRTWIVPPNSDLMAAARKNSTLPAWLATLRLLSRSQN